MILRYIISRLVYEVSFSTSRRNQWLDVDFRDYASRIEFEENTCVGRYFEPAILELPSSSQRDILSNTTRHALYVPSPLFGNNDYPIQVRLLLLYASCNPPLSMSHSLASIKNLISEKIVSLLINVLLSNGAFQDSRDGKGIRCIRALLESEIGATIYHYSRDVLANEVEQLISLRFIDPMVGDNVLKLLEQLGKEKGWDQKVVIHREYAPSGG